MNNDHIPPEDTTQRRSDGDNLRICHVNIHSLGTGEQGPTSMANYKLNQIRTILQLEHKFDAIGLSETWLIPTVQDDDIHLENYVVHRKDRVGRGGGVCI